MCSGRVLLFMKDGDECLGYLLTDDYERNASKH